MADPEVTSGPFVESLGMRLRTAYLAFHRRANAIFSRLGVTADQYVVMAILAEQDSLTQKEIVDRAGSDPNTITAILRRLEEKSLVIRTPHPQDGRARCTCLSPSGQQLVRTLAHADRQLLHQVQAGFEPTELAQFLEYLNRIPAQLCGEENPND
jgi:DNA-binding MarR family transcriptional regulator